MRSIYYLFMGIILSSGTLSAQTTQNHFVLSQAHRLIVANLKGGSVSEGGVFDPA